MEFETHTVSFSLDRPEPMLQSLLAIVQAEQGRFKGSAAQAAFLLSAQKVLIIDTDSTRAELIAQLIHATGHSTLVAANVLEAFTLFLQGSYIPLAVILGKDYPQERLFLQRLIQQTMQKYASYVPLVQLIIETPPPPPPPPAKVISQPLKSFNPSTPLPSLGPISSPDWPLLADDKQYTRPEKLFLQDQSIGRYHLDVLIDGGDRGSVYRAYDLMREQDVALKVLPINNLPYAIIRVAEEETTLFQREMELLKSLPHPHILCPRNVGRSYVSGSPFIYKTMPYYAEGSLARWLNRYGAARGFSIREVLPLALQLADALWFLHENGLFYQNFKLSNILIRNPNTESDVGKLDVVLSDFAALQNGSFFSHAPEALPYMAPERWLGEVSAASDQYGLAAIIYELLTGRPPFQGASDYALRFLHTNVQPQAPGMYNSTLSPAIDSVLLRALAKKPEHRFANLEIFATALHRYGS